MMLCFVMDRKDRTMTTPPIDLNTSLKQYEQAWKDLNATRGTTATVRISKDLLRRLLTDHGTMASKLGLADK
jgi:hypothetical protein